MCRCILWIGGSNWRKRLASEVTFFMVFLHFEKIPCVPFCDYVVQVQVVCFCSCLRHFVEVSCGWSDVFFPRGENIVEATVLIVYPFEATGKRLYVGAFGWKAWLPKVTLSKTTNKNQEDFKKNGHCKPMEFMLNDIQDNFDWPCTKQTFHHKMWSNNRSGG